MTTLDDLKADEGYWTESVAWWRAFHAAFPQAEYLSCLELAEDFLDRTRRRIAKESP